MTEYKQKQQYTSTYEQFKLLGRGAYGSAFLVKNNHDGIYYVAKKMMLQGMSEKDTAAAWGQIDILKKFNDSRIPFIVQYKQCYHFQNTLIIIMQYCQHGDLATFLKTWKKKGQLLDEKLVVNWFIQLLFGVKALHSKNVLHRDLKAANVFLTGNKTLKIGDFGISKVLDNTSAKTFVGTPYYLSPEVCENRPYSLSSDLWSLGIIVYQMCTFNYPFQASNLLGLAMKILSDQVPSIPSKYSKQLSNIVTKLFIKDQKRRITIQQIFQTSIIKSNIRTFVQDQQQICKTVNIGKKNINRQIQQDEQNQSSGVINNNQSTMKTINSVQMGNTTNDSTMKTINSVQMGNTNGYQDSLGFSSSLTPKQRMLLKKQEQNRKRQQQLKQAALNSSNLRNFAKQKKFQTLASSGSNFNQKTVKPSSQNLQKQFQNQNKQKAQMNKVKSTFSKMQQINTQQLCETLNKIKQTMKTQNIKFQDIPLNQQMSHLTFNTIKLENKFDNKTIKQNNYDDRPIKPMSNHKGYEQIYQDQDQLQQYYDEQFQQYLQEQNDPEQKAKTIKKQFQQIKAFYQLQICNNNSPTKPKSNNQLSPVKKSFTQIPIANLKKTSSKIQQSQSLVGEKRYKQLYNLVKNQQIDRIGMKTKYNTNEIKAITLIEQIIYMQNQ